MSKASKRNSVDSSNEVLVKSDTNRNLAANCMLSPKAASPVSASSVITWTGLSLSLSANAQSVKTNDISDVIKICDQHVFEQTDLVQSILNVCSELTGISGCNKYCNQIITFCNKILTVTYQSTHSIIEICQSLSVLNLIQNESQNSGPTLSPNVKHKTTGKTSTVKVIHDEPVENEHLKEEIGLEVPVTTAEFDLGAKENFVSSDSDESIDVVDDPNWSTKLPQRQLDLDDANDVCCSEEEDQEMKKENSENENNDKQIPIESDSESYPECQLDPSDSADPEWEPFSNSKVLNSNCSATKEWQSDISGGDLKDKLKKLVRKKKCIGVTPLEEEFPCIYCQLKLRSAEARSKHEAKHQCEICGQILQIGQKKRHNLRHTGERNFVCDECGSKFATNSRLQYHKINVHQVERPFPCDQCAYTAKSTELLRKHKKAHSDVKNYLCTDCGACFKNLYDLKLHTVTHKDIWPFPCGVCPKKFKTKDRLQRHEKIHTDFFSYECNICGKKMHQSGNLTTHMRTHTGDKPYKCVKCGKGFAHNVTRKQHEEICYGSKDMSESDSNCVDSHFKNMPQF